MALGFRLPRSLLGYLSCNGCSAIYEDGIWRFDCGLRVADELVVILTDHTLLSVFASTHRRHHERGHKNQNWMVLHSVTYDDDGNATQTARCDCEEQP